MTVFLSLIVLRFVGEGEGDGGSVILTGERVTGDGTVGGPSAESFTPALSMSGLRN